MASTGILQRRDIKANLIASPPIDGELVYATDTDEHGFVNNGILHWKQLDRVQPIVTLTAPPTGLETDPVGTVYLVVTSIVSIAITPQNPQMNTTNGIATPIQFIATATYGDGTTSDVSNDVSWVSSDIAVVTISTSGLAEYVGTGAYGGIVSVTALLSGVTNQTNINLTYDS